MGRIVKTFFGSKSAVTVLRKASI